VLSVASVEHVGSHALVMRMKHLYVVLGDRPVTVYAMADEMPVSIVSTELPGAASTDGSGHALVTDVGVQNASSLVTLGSVTAAHAMSIVTPPVGAIRDGVAGALGAAEHWVVNVDPAVHVSPQALVETAKHVTVVDGVNDETVADTGPVWTPLISPTPEPKADPVSEHEPPLATQKYLYPMASWTGSHVMTTELSELPGTVVLSVPRLVGTPGSATHVVDSVAPLEAHVLPQSFVAFTQQVYDVYGSSDVTDPAVLEDVVPTPEPTATSSHDPPLVTQK